MTEDIDETEGLVRAERSAAQALKALETATRLLERRLDRARAAEEELSEGEVVQEVKAIVAAFQLAIQQEAKAREAGSRKYGAGPEGGMLDLDAARVEIRGRLARLRAAGEGGDIPCGAE
ncbi:MAG: hypothetical protein ACMUJJ_01265 [Roseicyclus sp.]|jgi:hypothetical protein|uniref:hypothetical protein n=1 Tax=Roseicyclus sp. TaxID=1914329 RepID=UPI003A83EE71